MAKQATAAKRAILSFIEISSETLCEMAPIIDEWGAFLDAEMVRQQGPAKRICITSAPEPSRVDCDSRRMAALPAAGPRNQLAGPSEPDNNPSLRPGLPG